MIASATQTGPRPMPERAAAQVLRAIQKAMPGDCDLTLRQLRVLVALGEQPMSVKHLQPVVELQKPVVTRCVSRLVDLGLVAKRRSTGDERMVDISRTAYGEQLVAMLNRLVDELMPHDAAGCPAATANGITL